jgi:hypothetical protein
MGEHYFVDTGPDFKCSCGFAPASLVELAQHYEEHRKCAKCGGKNLVPDPAALFKDAVTSTGAALLCGDCRK